MLRYSDITVDLQADLITLYLERMWEHSNKFDKCIFFKYIVFGPFNRKCAVMLDTAWCEIKYGYVKTSFNFTKLSFMDKLASQVKKLCWTVWKTFQFYYYYHLDVILSKLASCWTLTSSWLATGLLCSDLCWLPVRCSSRVVQPQNSWSPSSVCCRLAISLPHNNSPSHLSIG